MQIIFLCCDYNNKTKLRSINGQCFYVTICSSCVDAVAKKPWNRSRKRLWFATFPHTDKTQHNRCKSLKKNGVLWWDFIQTVAKTTFPAILFPAFARKEAGQVCPIVDGSVFVLFMKKWAKIANIWEIFWNWGKIADNRYDENFWRKNQNKFQTRSNCVEIHERKVLKMRDFCLKRPYLTLFSENALKIWKIFEFHFWLYGKFCDFCQHSALPSPVPLNEIVRTPL